MLNLIRLLIIAMVLTACVKEEYKYEATYDPNFFLDGDVVFRDSGTYADLGKIDKKLDDLYKLKKWEQLAKEVVWLDFTEDLTYFYLAEAAFHLGRYGSALKYYERSIGAGDGTLIGDERTCDHAFGNYCFGVELPAQAKHQIDLIKVRIAPREVIVSSPGIESNVSIQQDQQQFPVPHTFRLRPGEYQIQFFTDDALFYSTIEITEEAPSNFSFVFKPEEADGLLSVKSIGVLNKIEKDKHREFMGQENLHSITKELVVYISNKNDEIRANKNLLNVLDPTSSLGTVVKDRISLIEGLTRKMVERMERYVAPDLTSHLAWLNVVSEVVEPAAVEMVNLTDSTLEGGKDEVIQQVPEKKEPACSSYVMTINAHQLQDEVKEVRKSDYRSSFVERHDVRPNPRYSELRSQLRDAEYELQKAKIDHENSSDGYDAASALVMLVLKRKLESQHEEKVDRLQQQLNSMPRTITEAVEANYTVAKNDVSFVKTEHYDWSLTNCTTGSKSFHQATKSEERVFTLYKGVNQKDVNKLKQKNAKVKREMKVWSKAPLILRIPDKYDH